MKEGIIVRCPQIRLSEFEGEYSYLGTTLRQANIEPMPSLSDVRRLVTEFGILPLGKSSSQSKLISYNCLVVGIFMQQFSLFAYKQCFTLLYLLLARSAVTV